MVVMRSQRPDEPERRAEIHLTHISAPGDEAGLRRLGINLTNDTNVATRNLFLA